MSQSDSNGNGNLNQKLTSIVEDEEDVQEVDETTPLSHISTSVTYYNQSLNFNKTTNTSNLLAANQQHLSGRIDFRSPIRGCGVMIRSRQDHESVNIRSEKNKNFKLHLSALNSYAPPDLSPRIVDGIEDEKSSIGNQRFEFCTENTGQESFRLTHAKDLDQVTPAMLAAKAEETKQQIKKLNDEMCNLTQEVSQLGKDLHNVVHLLESLLTAQKNTPFWPVRGAHMAPTVDNMKARMAWTSHQPCFHMQGGTASCVATNPSQNSTVAADMWPLDSGIKYSNPQGLGIISQRPMESDHYHVLSTPVHAQHCQSLQGDCLPRVRCVTPHSDTTLTPLQSMSVTLSSSTGSSPERANPLAFPCKSKESSSSNLGPISSSDLGNSPDSWELEGMSGISLSNMAASPMEVMTSTDKFKNDSAINL